MKYKRGLIFICLLIFLFSVASVAANELNETVVANEDQNDGVISIENEEVILDDAKVNEVGATEENKLGTSPGTFTDLAKDIKNAGDELNLNRNYIYNNETDSSYNEGITIDKKIIIHGNGFSIDGNNQARAIKSSFNNIILTNISFINCYSYDGGAFYCLGSDCKLLNCNFINCSSTAKDEYEYGGSIYWLGDNGIVENCSFSNCTSKSSSSYGGAIYWAGKQGIVINSSFSNCYSAHGGGVNWNGDYGKLFDCEFDNVTSKNTGGAISWKGINGVLYNCNFSYSSTRLFGGAIHWSGINGTLFDCNFINCFVKSSITPYGGAVYWRGDCGNLFACNFINCSAIGGRSIGGAIDWFANDGYVSNCSFINCRAKNEGGAVIWSGYNGLLSDSIFVNCSDYNVYLKQGDLKLVDCNCSNNNLSVIYKTFININAADTIDFGEVIILNTTVIPGAVGKIGIYVNDIFKNYINVGDIAYLNDLNAGVNIIKVVYRGDDFYGENTTSIKVNKIKSNIAISILNLTYDNTILSVTLNNKTTGKVTVTINNKNYTETLNNGNALICIHDLNVREYNYTVSYFGDNNFNQNRIKSVLTTQRKESNLNISVEDVYLDKINDFFVKYNIVNLSGRISVYVNNEFIKNISVGDIIKLNNLTVGNYSIKLVYSGNEYYNGSEDTAAFKVFHARSYSNIIVDDTIGANASYTISIKLNEDVTGFIIITIKDKQYSGNVTNGTFNFTTNRLDLGINNMSINYTGDNNYNPLYVVKKINVFLKNPNLKVNVGNMLNGDYLTINPSVNTDATGTFKIYVDDVFKRTINVGYTYTLSSMSIGKHEIKIIYSGDNYFKSENITTSFRVFSRYPIESKDMQIIQGSNNYFQAKFYDEYGAVLVNKYIIFNVNGNDISIRTDSNGIAKLNENLNIGEYNITIINPTANENKTNKLLIFTSVESEDRYTVNNTDFEFNATFFDKNAEILQTTPILFKINGEDKVVTTNVEGVATLKLNLDIGIYDIISINTVTDENKTNKLFVKSSSTGKYTIEIDEKDINMPALSASTNESATVKLPADASGTIILNINGKDYEFNVTKGIANIKVPELNNGNYPYTITYSGDLKYSSFSKTGSLVVDKPNGSSEPEQTTPIESEQSNPYAPFVKTTLTLKTVKVKKSAKKLVLQATLKQDNTPIKGTKITFKFNGKKYTAKTNAKGVAKVTINKNVLKKLKVGKKVKYQASYGKVTAKKTAKVKK